MLASMITSIKHQEDSVVHGVKRVRQPSNKPATRDLCNGADVYMPAFSSRSYGVDSGTMASPVDPSFSAGTWNNKKVARRSRATKYHSSQRRSHAYRPQKTTGKKSVAAYRVMTPAYRNDVVTLPSSRVYTPRYDPYVDGTPFHGAKTPFYGAGGDTAFKSPYHAAGMNGAATPAYAPGTPFCSAGMNQSSAPYAPKSPYYAAGMNQATPAYAPKSPYYTAGMNYTNPSINGKSPFYAKGATATSTTSGYGTHSRSTAAVGSLAAPKKAAPTPTPSSGKSTPNSADSSSKSLSSSTYVPSAPSMIDVGPIWKAPTTNKKQMVHFNLSENDSTEGAQSSVGSISKDKTNEGLVAYDPTQPQYSPSYDPDPYFNNEEYNPMFPFMD